MKQKILEALKAKFVGVSDKILDRIADKLAKTVTNEEGVAPAVDGVTFAQVLESYGDSRATEASQTAISNYEKKHGLKDGAKVDDGGVPKDDKTTPKKKDDDDTIPAWAQTLIDSNKQLTERLNNVEKERVGKSRKKQLTAALQSLPEAIQKAYSHTPVDSLSDEDFESLMNDVKSEATAIGDELKRKGAVFGGQRSPRSEGSQEKEATAAETDAVLGKLNI